MQHILTLLSEIGLLVHEQGEYIDTIEAQISKANNYVERANKHLVKAKKDHTAKKKVIYLLVEFVTNIFSNSECVVFFVAPWFFSQLFSAGLP